MRRKPERDPMKRLMRDVHKNEGGCWLWVGPRNDLKYGTTSYNGKSIGAHRLSWIVHKGAIPAGLLVCHRCDNPPCVNPDHLFLGNDYENAMDCVRKGRHYTYFRQRKKVVDGVWVCQKRGHPMIGENVEVQKDGRMNCFKCHRDGTRAYYHAKAPTHYSWPGSLACGKASAVKVTSDYEKVTCKSCIRSETKARRVAA